MSYLRSVLMFSIIVVSTNLIAQTTEKNVNGKEIVIKTPSNKWHFIRDLITADRMVAEAYVEKDKTYSDLALSFCVGARSILILDLEDELDEKMYKEASRVLDTLFKIVGGNVNPVNMNVHDLSVWTDNTAKIHDLIVYLLKDD